MKKIVACLMLLSLVIAVETNRSEVYKDKDITLYIEKQVQEPIIKIVEKVVPDAEKENLLKKDITLKDSVINSVEQDNEKLASGYLILAEDMDREAIKCRKFASLANEGKIIYQEVDKAREWWDNPLLGLFVGIIIGRL